jgi:hypothetical protein
LIKEAACSRAKTSIGNSRRLVQSSPLSDIVQKILFFLNRQTANPTIKEKTFSLAKIALWFADRTFCLLMFSTVR